MPRDLIKEAEIATPLDADGKVLEKAADWLEKHGWCQGGEAARAFAESGVPTCIGVALQIANPRKMHFHSVFDRLGLGLDLVAWNDTPGRTAAEVIARLRAAARGQL